MYRSEDQRTMRGEAGGHTISACPGHVVGRPGDVSGSIDASHGRELLCIGADDWTVRALFHLAAQLMGNVAVQPSTRTEIERIHGRHPPVGELNRTQARACA